MATNFEKIDMKIEFYEQLVKSLAVLQVGDHTDYIVKNLKAGERVANSIMNDLGIEELPE